MEDNDFEKEIKLYLESYSIYSKRVEKDVIEILKKLLNLFYSVINTNAKGDLIDNNEEINKLFSEDKLQITTFLKDKGYQPKEFEILKDNDFDDHLIYLPTLMNNLYYYLNKYEFDQGNIHLYFYLFHLIYFLLLIIKESKEKMVLNDDIFKFYLFHIVQFFKKDEQTPENNYFFYHGAFKQLKKKYNIKTDYVMDFKIKIFDFTIPYSIQQILYTFQSSKLLSINKNELMTMIQKFYNDIMSIYHNLNLNNIDQFINLFNAISEGIDEIEKNLGEIKCDELIYYKNKIDIFKRLISERRMSKNDLNLMEANYFLYSKKNKKCYYDILEYIEYANFFNSCDKDSDKDYTESFKNIINSNKFKTLYLKAMNSTHIKNFVKDFNLEEDYKIFMKNYSEKINEYILYVPLTRGIKAYVSNYLRIALNINSVEIIGEFDENLKNEYFSSFLLIEMVKESFHFLVKHNKEGKNSSDEMFPKRKQKKVIYENIDTELIYYIFGTEYIPFISKNNCILICNPKSWENPSTNFKVFNNVSLFKYKLNINEDTESDTDFGLKCHISSEYESCSLRDVKICTDDVIKYCF